MAINNNPLYYEIIARKVIDVNSRRKPVRQILRNGYLREIES